MSNTARRNRTADRARKATARVRLAIVPVATAFGFILSLAVAFVR